MSKFDSKTFNPEAFGKYIENIPNVTKTELAKSKAVAINENAAQALSTQTGSVYATIPYFGRINGGTAQNNDGSTDISSSNLTTFDQGFVVASRMDSWTERSFSQNITAGVNFMDAVAEQIADYKMEVKQGILLAILKGVFSMSTTGNTVPAKAAKEFMESHVYDISAIGEGVVDQTTLNRAIQKASGDNKNAFKLVIMHSEVATNLENLKLLHYLTYTDANGVERELQMATWNGRTVLIDDNMPVETVGTGDTAYQTYTTYVIGEGAITLQEIGDSVPYEMGRDAKTNGGQDTLYVRDRYICGVNGISFVKPAGSFTSASNSDLMTGANWNIINDGVNSIPCKSIAIAKIVSKG